MNLKVIKLIRKNRVLLAANAKHVHLMIYIKIHDLSGHWREITSSTQLKDSLPPAFPWVAGSLWQNLLGQ